VKYEPPESSPETVVFREAGSDDLQSIRGMIREERLNPLGLDWKRFVVGEDEEGDIVACGQVKAHADGSRELASLVVREPWRGSGLGGKIIELLLSSSDPPLWLTCRSTLIPFYIRFGFHEVEDKSAMPRYFRWASRLMNVFLNIAGRDDYLAVMRWVGK
jgi:N-acetylglutamate synthase-like GNAT family acetyltransferase